jgi:hypothetical protein
VRKSTAFLAVTSVNIVLFALLMVHAWRRQGDAEKMLLPCREIAKELQLTDLCLFTEARYTRHPSMADLHAPFQDHPLALEHFPSGSLVTPPRFHREAP